MPNRFKGSIPEDTDAQDQPDPSRPERIYMDFSSVLGPSCVIGMERGSETEHIVRALHQVLSEAPKPTTRKPERAAAATRGAGSRPGRPSPGRRTRRSPSGKRR